MKIDRDKYNMTWRVADPQYLCGREVPSRVIGTTPKRVRIAALLRNGKERVHLVDVGTLSHDPCHCLCECGVIDDLKQQVGAAVSQ